MDIPHSIGANTDLKGVFKMVQSAFMKRMVKLMKADKAKKDPFASG